MKSAYRQTRVRAACSNSPKNKILLTANVKDIIWKVQEATEKIARKIENI